MWRSRLNHPKAEWEKTQKRKKKSLVCDKRVSLIFYFIFDGEGREEKVLRDEEKKKSCISILLELLTLSTL